MTLVVREQGADRRHVCSGTATAADQESRTPERPCYRSYALHQAHAHAAAAAAAAAAVAAFPPHPPSPHQAPPSSRSRARLRAGPAPRGRGEGGTDLMSLGFEGAWFLTPGAGPLGVDVEVRHGYMRTVWPRREQGDTGAHDQWTCGLTVQQKLGGLFEAYPAPPSEISVTSYPVRPSGRVGSCAVAVPSDRIIPPPRAALAAALHTNIAEVSIVLQTGRTRIQLFM